MTEMEMNLPMLREPVDTLRSGLGKALATEAAAPHPVQAFQVTVSLWVLMIDCMLMRCI